MNDMILEIRHLSKSFGTHEVLRDIDFSVAKGDVTSIIGASGSGKSTLLRCVNLLETPYQRRDPLPRAERGGCWGQRRPVPLPRGHGIPILQPVQQHDRAGKLCGGSGEGS